MLFGFGLGIVSLGIGLFLIQYPGVTVVALIAIVIGIMFMAPVLAWCFKELTTLIKTVKQAGVEIKSGIKDTSDAIKKRKLQKMYDTTMNCSSNILSINDNISVLLKNKNLCKILKNYTTNNALPIDILEFCIAPLKLSCGYQLSLPALEQNDSTYLKTLKNFTNDIIQENQSLCEIAFSIKTKNFNNENGILEDIYDLYKTLRNQNYFSDNDNNYYAFLYLLYLFRKKEIYKSAKTILDVCNIPLNDDKNFIVKELIDCDFSDDQIVSILYGIESHKEKYTDLFIITNDNLKQELICVIKDLREKDKLKALLAPQKALKYSIEDVDFMSGVEFENFVVYLFTQLGYKTSHTKLSGDQGIDVIAKKRKTTTAIQCKCFHGSVGNHAIMEAYAGAKYYNADKCMVVTNSVFTKSAKELANKNGVILWDRKILIEKLSEL